MSSLQNHAEPRPAVEALLEKLRAHYPDLSAWRVVSLTGRGRDFLHHQIHSRIGGLLPAVLSFDEYKLDRLGESLGRTAVPEDEAFLRFHAFISRREGRALAPADSQRLLSFLAAIGEFNVSPAELRALERIGPEQVERIDSFFALQEAFRSELAREGLFYPPFEAERFAGMAPKEGDLFFGLPLMTPANQNFFKRIPKERLFTDAPLFGPAMPQEPPAYESALSLLKRCGLPEQRGDGQGLAFSELSERAGLPALLGQEIVAFLAGPRPQGEQLFIVPLDEGLSFYLWEGLFRPLGNQVNFAPWLPFTHFAPAERLRLALRSGKGLASVRRELVAELTTRWAELDEADRSAFEAAIDLIDELTRLKPLMAEPWLPVAEYLISAKKLRLHGRRSAPIQVVALGDATGIPYHRALIGPMNSGVFPSLPFSGPYLNLIHLPRLYRAQYEAEDLALRQFLAFGRSAHLVSLYDQAKGEAPSAHFSFLATEFGQKAVKRRLAPEPFRVAEWDFAIANSPALQEKLRSHVWSFTTLKKFFTCPCRFIIEEIEKIEPPACFEDEEGANLLIGEFLHRFFSELMTPTTTTTPGNNGTPALSVIPAKAGIQDRSGLDSRFRGNDNGGPGSGRERPVIDRWLDRFDSAWEADRAIQEKLPDQAVRKAIVKSYLADIATWEKETGEPLLFSDTVTESELTLSAPFGEGRYQLKGRIDRMQAEGDRLLITDLKYREKKTVSERTPLTDLVDKPDHFDDRFQLLLYAYLALQKDKAKPGGLSVAHLFLRPKSRGDYAARLSDTDLAACEETMARIVKRLDILLAQECFTPNFRARDCAYCPHKALCLRPDLYRTGGRPW